MKNLKIVFAVILSLAFIQSYASINVTAENGESIENNNAGSAVLKVSAADCNPPTATASLNINNVRAGLLNGGDLWWDATSIPKYEVPKVDPATGNTQLHSIFAGALWIGGIDAGGQLKVAAQTYRQTGNDFWPGPLDNDGNVEQATCSNFDMFFEVRAEIIDKFKTLYAEAEQAGVSITASEIEGLKIVQENVTYTGRSLLGWPALNSVYFNTVHGYDLPQDQALAPFWDNNGDGIYNPIDGDFPTLGNCNNANTDVIADQMIWWIYNDKGNIHTETQGESIGLEVSAMAFAFATNDEINNMTFYKYEVRNKASTVLDSVYFAQFVDPDLGNYLDDYVGCDTSASLGIVYNGDANDEGAAGYTNAGQSVPMLGVDFFKGPLDENGEELGMSAFIYYNNDFSQQGNPENASHFYGYMAGVWKNQQPVTYGADGFVPGNEPTPFMFPSDPEDQGADAWSECSVGNLPADRRFLQVSGPFQLKSGAVNEIIVGVVWINDVDYPCPSFDPILRADKKAQALFDNCFELIDGPDAPEMEIRELDNELILSIYNLEGSNNYLEGYNEFDPIITEENVDSTYTFQGYKIYQFADASASLSDIGDETKVKEIFQVDVRDEVIELINYEKSDLGDAYELDLKVDGNNDGLRKSFRVTTDQFTNGNLVNWKKYYFGVVAYADNQFRKFSALDPELGGQEKEYLEGRKGSNRKYVGIPHDPTPQNGGMVLNSAFGDGAEIETLGGTGNGGLFLELTDETVASILTNNYVPNPKYKPNFGPIDLSIYDPVLVKDHGYIVNFDESITEWDIENTTLGLTYPEDRKYAFGAEQAIPEYGMDSEGINIGILQNTGTNPVNNTLGRTNLVIGTEFEYEDELNNWLTFVSDEEDDNANNWIRSGTDTDNIDDIQDDYPYDDNQVYESVANGTFAPYCLTAVTGQSTGDIENDYDDYFTFGPAFAHNGTEEPVNTLDDLMSIDLVFTPNKDEWTRSAVIDLAPFNPSGIRHDRKSLYSPDDKNSLDKNGVAIVGRGMSYFPGYAINVETGERLNIMFGENSFAGANTNDMIWNPTSIPGNPATGNPIWGGMHNVYIMKTRYDGGDNIDARWKVYETDPAANLDVKKSIYEDVAWVTIPYMQAEGDFKALDIADGLVPNRIKVKVRVSKPYEAYDNNEDGTLQTPKYRFSFTDKQATKNDGSIAENALDKISVVPNPYYAFSTYENNSFDSRVKIINLPNRAVITILSLDGTLIRSFNFDGGDTDFSIGGSDLTNSIEWDLTNTKGIKVASGAYIIHIDAEGIGERTLKWFGVMREIDLGTF